MTIEQIIDQFEKRYDAEPGSVGALNILSDYTDFLRKALTSRDNHLREVVEKNKFRCTDRECEISNHIVIDIDDILQTLKDTSK